MFICTHIQERGREREREREVERVRYTYICIYNTHTYILWFVISLDTLTLSVCPFHYVSMCCMIMPLGTCTSYHWGGHKKGNLLGVVPGLSWKTDSSDTSWVALAQRHQWEWKSFGIIISFMAKHWRSLKYRVARYIWNRRPGNETYVCLFDRICAFLLIWSLRPLDTSRIPKRERLSSRLHLPTWTWIAASQRHRDRLKLAH